MTTNNCPVCSGSSATEVLKLENLPVAINAQTTPELASTVTKGNLQLVVCNTCTHLFNAVFDANASSYDSSYENSLHYSDHFQQHAKTLAIRLVEDHALNGATVAEAGAGPGHFLTMLCSAGVGKAYGFDPSYDAERLGAPQHSRVELSQGMFPTDGSLEPKLAFSQHVLEHLEHPVELLKILHESVKGHSGGAVYSEVPNGQVMIDRCALWDLIYEHYSYFTPISLALATQLAGMSADKVQPIYDDQFLSIDSSTSSSDVKYPEKSVVEKQIEQSIAFGNLARARIEQAHTELNQYAVKGPVALWGAGSKGMTYLNLVATQGEISAIIDVNPRKTGFGIPGVPGVIGSPESLKEVQPKTVLIANPVYANEIQSTLNELGHKDVNILPLWK